MRRSPLKQDPRLTLFAALLSLCMLLLALTPAVGALHVRDMARDMGRAHTHMRGRMSVENGIITDDDGIIGNSATGADHAPSYGRAHHARAQHSRPHALPRLMASSEAAPPPLQDGIGGMMGRGESGDLARHATPGAEHRGRTLADDGTLPDSDTHTEDGVIGDGNAENGVIEQDPNAAENGIAQDDVADGSGDMTDGNGDMTDGINDGTNGGGDASGGSDGVTEDGNASARSLLPWIIGIIVVLAAVLVVLALMPRHRKQ